MWQYWPCGHVHYGAKLECLFGSHSSQKKNEINSKLIAPFRNLLYLFLKINTLCNQFEVFYFQIFSFHFAPECKSGLMIVAILATLIRLSIGALNLGLYTELTKSKQGKKINVVIYDDLEPSRLQGVVINSRRSLVIFLVQNRSQDSILTVGYVLLS